MKKLVTLLLAAGMVFGSFTGAQAIDWKVKGAWQFEFGYYSGLKLERGTSRTSHRSRYGNGNGGDNFSALQRMNFVLEAVASENLSGTLQFELGHYIWGKAQGDAAWGHKTFGGALGQREGGVAVRQAYIDWFVPNTELKVRMGIQRLDTPSFTFGVNVFHEDVAAVTASYKFNENASVVAFWARPYNDNFAGAGQAAPYQAYGDNGAAFDNVDAFGLVIPLAFDGFKVTPWGMIGAIGPNALRQGYAGQRWSSVQAGLTPNYYATHDMSALGSGFGGDGPNNYGTAWWAGITGEITAADPFRFAWDATYGSVSWADASYLDRKGWYINILAEYKLDWAVPGIYAWWASGDDENPRNGSERMPVFVNNTPDNQLSTFGYTGSPAVGSPDGAFGASAYTGTWGIGARIRDITFLEDLKHTLRVNFFGGTNSPIMAKYITGKKMLDENLWVARSSTANNNFNTGGAAPYLTTQDYGIEVNFDSVYKIYENLEMFVELGYIHLWLDQGSNVWGSGGAKYPFPGAASRGTSVTDAVKAAVYFKYSF